MTQDILKASLNTINRTLLFFNGKEEWEDFTQLSFSSNNNASKFGFKKCYQAFNKLSEQAKDFYNINLSELLDIYGKISDSLSKKHRIVREPEIYDIISTYIFKEETASQKLDFAVFILLQTGLLPKINTRKCRKNTLKDFEKLFSLFDGCCKEKKLIHCGYISKLYDMVKKLNTEDLPRILLISTAADILLILRNLNNTESKISAITNFKNAEYDLRGIYCSYDDYNTLNFWMLGLDEEKGRNYVFWHFVDDGETVKGTCYNAFIKEDRGLRFFAVISEKFARKICEKSAIENEECLFCLDFSHKKTRLYPEDDDTIKKLELEKVNSLGMDLGISELYRVKNDKIYWNKIERRIELTDQKYLFKQYGNLSAVTTDFLFISLTEEVKAALNTSKNLVKFPRKNEFVSYDSINYEAFFVIFGDGVVYLVFANLGVSIPQKVFEKYLCE